MGPDRKTRRIGMICAMGIALTAAGGCSGASGKELRYDCQIATPKPASALEDLCQLFGERLSAAYPGYSVARAETTQHADMILVVERADARVISARIDVGGRPGIPFAAARADAGLDRTAQSGFLDNLIAASERPR